MKALITGITGQSGSYLAELLLAKGVEVHGLIRRVSVESDERIASIKSRLVLHSGDMLERGCIGRVVRQVEPDWVFNLAAQSHVHESFAVPEYTFDVDAMAFLRLLEEVRTVGLRAKVYQASTSEMFGLSVAPQSERTPFHPRSPYACAKVASHQLAVNYRESYGMFISCGILFNHESPRRGATFVTRKIARGAARISLGLDKELVLGNLEAKRDWGHARDYMRAAILMLEQEVPDDYVVATGESRSVAEFAAAAFGHVGLDWSRFVKVDDCFKRPAEVPDLRGDASKARRVLGWEPETMFEELVREMVDAELDRAKR